MTKIIVVHLVAMQLNPEFYECVLKVCVCRQLHASGHTSPECTYIVYAQLFVNIVSLITQL